LRFAANDKHLLDSERVVWGQRQQVVDKLWTGCVGPEAVLTMAKKYCVLGFGNNFFYPFGSDSLEVPPNLLDDGERNNNGKEAGATLRVDLLPINPAGGTSSKNKATESDTSDDVDSTATASEWLQSQLVSNNSSSKFSSNSAPLLSCGATHTSFVFPKQSTSAEMSLMGTIFGRTYQKLTVQPTRLPLRIVRIASGRRHVLALSEGVNDGGGGGVVMSWGAGHFGQLGHGPELTSCLEPRIIERLLPHVVGGAVIEIAAGGLHSAAIVASSSSSKKQKTTKTAGDSNGDTNASVTVRETRTFSWGSNRKGQCGVEGGKCATVPEPLPIVNVKRKSGIGGAVGKSDPVDKYVHFEKISLGRLHTVALTAYGEVFTWGSTAMGRCGHSSLESGRDRRFVQEPRHISALRNVVIDAVAAGDAHTLALSKGGRLFAWGAGSDGQCGQGHAGSLFSPRAIQEINFIAKKEIENGETTTKNDGMPHVVSAVAMEVALEEEALTKALSTKDVTKPDDKQPQSSTKLATIKYDKIKSIRAAGCYSAAVTKDGDVYTWGYGGGVALGHPIPKNEADLPLLPIIEGNQYSSSITNKVYPEGGSESSQIRDCKCFDTELNVLLPRKVECTRKLGCHVEDVALGPGHMMILCSIGGNTEGDETESTLVSSTDSDENIASSQSCGSGGDLNASTPAQCLSSLEDAPRAATPGVESVVTSLESFESGNNPKNEKRGWVSKIKSSRSNKSCAVETEPVEGKEKKKSPISKMLNRVRK
jgi:alpha-tubulin suppressor-like RCC1 family protein